MTGLCLLYLRNELEVVVFTWKRIFPDRCSHQFPVIASRKPHVTNFIRHADTAIIPTTSPGARHLTFKQSNNISLWNSSQRLAHVLLSIKLNPFGVKKILPRDDTDLHSPPRAAVCTRRYASAIPLATAAPKFAYNAGANVWPMYTRLNLTMSNAR